MPRDVSTRWNSTFDMLKFAIRYRVAIDAMTTVCQFDLHKYELVPAEWAIATELRDILKVSNLSSPLFCTFTLSRLDFQRRNSILFSRHPQPGHHCPCHGTYQRRPYHII